jgi:hypothetical protein
MVFLKKKCVVAHFCSHSLSLGHAPPVSTHRKVTHRRATQQPSPLNISASLTLFSGYKFNV